MENIDRILMWSQLLIIWNYSGSYEQSSIVFEPKSSCLIKRIADEWIHLFKLELVLYERKESPVEGRINMESYCMNCINYNIFTRTSSYEGILIQIFINDKVSSTLTFWYI